VRWFRKCLEAIIHGYIYAAIRLEHLLLVVELLRRTRPEKAVEQPCERSNEAQLCKLQNETGVLWECTSDATPAVTAIVAPSITTTSSATTISSATIGQLRRQTVALKTPTESVVLRLVRRSARCAPP